jgi:uncharacterized protein (DUF1786 family)
MSRFLMIDVGAGTMDILHYDDTTGEHFKIVAPSPVRTVAWTIRQTRGPLAVSGVEMGGGPVTEALTERLKRNPVAISLSAATLNHDMEKVRGWGFSIVRDELIDSRAADFSHTPVRLADIQPERINQLLDGMGLPTGCDVVAVCAQDHGVPPPGTSHLDFRHNLYLKYLSDRSSPADLLFRADEIPVVFNRLQGMAQSAAGLGAKEIYAMDSGMAAILGASQDLSAAGRQPVAVMDIATSHTVVAILSGDVLESYFEYHTRDITLERLELLLRELAEGRIEHHAILAEKGHGAYVRRAVGFDNLKAVVVTGPKRALLAESRLPIVWGAPWGDNMMTGTVGLLEAVRRRRRMEPIRYL